MATKTIYVRDEDVAVWDKAKDFAGESLSQFLTSYLKNFVAIEEAKTLGLKRITLHYRENGVPVAKAFSGNWIVSPKAPYVETAFLSPGHFMQKYVMAVTAKNNIVCFKYTDHPNSTLADYITSKELEKFGEGTLSIFSNFEEVKSAKYPPGFLAAAVEKMGVEIQEMDI